MSNDGSSTLLNNRNVSIRESVLFHIVDEEMVLLDIESGEYYGLNKTGSKIWEMLSEGQTVCRIHASLQEIYDVTAERLWQDMESFISLLISKGFVEINERSA